MQGARRKVNRVVLSTRPFKMTSQKPETVRYGPSPSQFIHFHTPPATAPRPFPLAIILHGGFWKSRFGISPPTAGIETLAPDLISRGFGAAEIEYRRSADAEWGWPHTNHDVAAAYEKAVSQPGVDSRRVFVLGHSVGGTLALWLAAQLASGGDEKELPVHTYAIAPIADLRRSAKMRLSSNGDAVQRYLRGEPHEVPEQYAKACPMDAAQVLARLPVTLVVGQRDPVVPEEIIRAFYDKVSQCATDLRVENDLLIYKVFGDADHYQLVSAIEPAWQWIVADIEQRSSQNPSIAT